MGKETDTGDENATNGTDDDKSESANDITQDQLAHLGGDLDDLDTEDFSAADRGDDFDPDAKPPEDKEDSDDDDKDSEDSSEADGDDDDSDEADGDDSDSADDDASDDEGEDDDSEDDADQDDDDSEDTSAKDDKNEDKSGIPRWRFNEVNERAKAAEAEIARRDKEEKAADDAAEEQFDFDTAEKEYMDLLLDGKTDDALAKRNEIRAAEREQFKTETKTETKNEVNATAVATEINSLATQAEQMYPVFDATHDDFNPTISSKVMTFYQGYVAAGELAQGDAFVAAVADVIDLYDLDTKYGDTSDKNTDSSDKDDGKSDQEEGKDKDGKKAGKKRIDKTKQKIDASGNAHTPIADQGKGGDSAGVDTIDLEQMTDEEMDALPEATMKRLRGDFN